MNYQSFSKAQGVSTSPPYNKSNLGNTLIQPGSNTNMNYQSLSAQGVSTPPPSTTTVRHQSMFIDPHFDYRQACYTSLTGSPHFDYRRACYPQGSPYTSHTSLTGSLHFDPRVPVYPPNSPSCTSILHGASQFDPNSDYLFDNDMEAEGVAILGTQELKRDEQELKRNEQQITMENQELKRDEQEIKKKDQQLWENEQKIKSDDQKLEKGRLLLQLFQQVDQSNKEAQKQADQSNKDFLKDFQKQATDFLRDFQKQATDFLKDSQQQADQSNKAFQEKMISMVADHLFGIDTQGTPSGTPSVTPLRNDSPDLIADYFALKQAHEESERCNAKLERQCKAFKEKYDREKAENTRLKAENTRLKAEKAKLKEQLGA